MFHLFLQFGEFVYSTSTSHEIIIKNTNAYNKLAFLISVVIIILHVEYIQLMHPHAAKPHLGNRRFIK